MNEWLKKFIRVHSIWSSIILFIFFSSLFVCIYFIELNDKQSFETNLLYSLIALCISSILILLAYLKAQEALEQSKTNHLLRIDERWTSPEIIRAREIIHDIYLNAKRLNPQLKEDNEQIKPVIAFAIMKLHDNPNRTEEFIKLLNFLDFLETIGYLHSKNSITTKDVSELLGNSIIYFYEIFSIYIAYRRKTKDIEFYMNFEKLYLEVKLNAFKKNNSLSTHQSTH